MSELTIEFTTWLKDVLSKASILINFWSDEKIEYRKKIIYPIVYVCIKEVIPWIDLNDAKTALISFAGIDGGKLLPEEIEYIRKDYGALKILRKRLDEKEYYKIKQSIDNDLISAPKVQPLIKAMDKRITTLRSGVASKKIETGGRPKDPLLNSILYRCDCAFDHYYNKEIYENIALFVNAIFLNEIINVENAGNLVRLRIKSIMKNAKGETDMEKYLDLDKEWESIRKQIKLK